MNDKQAGLVVATLIKEFEELRQQLFSLTNDIGELQAVLEKLPRDEKTGAILVKIAQ